MENKCYHLRYLPIFEQDLVSTANYITNILKMEVRRLLYGARDTDKHL